MHIAVLVYGRLNKCVEHYSTIVSSLDSSNNIIDFFLSSDEPPQELLQEFINIYKPVSYINDKISYSCDFGKYNGLREETKIHNMTCHFINKSRVFTLLEEHIETTQVQYDCVISLRVDLLIKSTFIITDIKENTVYIPHDYDFAGGINDNIAYGNVSSMKKYMNIYNNTTYLLENGMSIPHPENLTRANITFTNLELIRFPLTYSICRMSCQ